MKKLSLLQNKILSILLRANGKLDSFTLFKRSRVLLSEFSLAIKTLSTKKMLCEYGNDICLTEEGKQYILAVTPEQTGKYKWRKVPDHFQIDAIQIEEPYIPNIQMLDKSTFHITQSDVD